MSQDSIPLKIYSSNEVREQVAIDYTCPNCGAENTAAVDSPGWVSCPILDGKFMCVGCCTDVSYAAMKDIDDTLRNYALDEIAATSGKNKSDARIVCLRHQIEMLRSRVRESSEPTTSRKSDENLLEKLQVLLES